MLNIIVVSQELKYMWLYEETGKYDWEAVMTLEYFVEDTNSCKYGIRGKFCLGC